MRTNHFNHSTKEHFRKKSSPVAGFTLLEMMIVVAMIALLTTLAVPSYQRYTQRAKFIEVIQALAPYKTSVTLCAYQEGDLKQCSNPGINHVPQNFKSHVSDQGYVDSITVHEGALLTATSKRIRLAKKDTFTYTLKPILLTNGALHWVVDDSDPNSCKHYHLC